MKRVWSQTDSGTIVRLTAASSKRRKVERNWEFPIPLLNEDVWCYVLRFMKPEKATILRMVCKYFKQDRFAVMTDKKKAILLPKVSKEALLGTNSPVFVENLPSVRLTDGRLKALRNRCYQYDDEYEFFKFALQCGMGLKKPAEWFALGEIGCKPLLAWIRTLPPAFLHSRKSLLAGLIVRKDAEILDEIATYMNIRWDAATIASIFDALGCNNEGIVNAAKLVTSIFDILTVQASPPMKLDPAFFLEIIDRSMDFPRYVPLGDPERLKWYGKPVPIVPSLDDCVNRFLDLYRTGEANIEVVHEILDVHKGKKHSPVLRLLQFKRPDLALLILPVAYRWLPSAQDWLLLFLASTSTCSQLIDGLLELWVPDANKPVHISDQMIMATNRAWYYGRRPSEQTRVHYAQIPGLPAITPL
jgi:hypothetical protein